MGWRIYQIILDVFLKFLFGPCTGSFDPCILISIWTGAV